MRFQVSWLARAEHELLELWLAARDRQRITDATNAIDQQLARDPQSAGESRYDDLRILLKSPIDVYFSVDVHQQRVAVLHVWKY